MRAEWLRENRTRAAVLAVLLVLFLGAMGGLDSDDWFATIMQGLSVGAITFLVASGLSLIFGLMDVLNLAHGELFMLGAYVGWTVYTRFDTVIDVAVPILLIAAPFALLPSWRRLAQRLPAAQRARRTGRGWRCWLVWRRPCSGLPGSRSPSGTPKPSPSARPTSRPRSIWGC